jgi:hypothetical protein
VTNAGEIVLSLRFFAALMRVRICGDGDKTLWLFPARRQRDLKLIEENSTGVLDERTKEKR